MLNVKVDNIYINDTTNKIRINSDGVELKNEYYEYESPYVNDGLQFTLNVNSINVIIADKRKQDIIIPNSAPMFVDNKLKTFPIEYVEINLNENIRYIYINDTIKTLKITGKNENVIISIPNKEFTITTNDTTTTDNTTTTNDINDTNNTDNTQNKKIKYLILHDYSENNNFYNLTSLSATLINLTHNSDIDLFNDYNQTSVSNLKNNIPQSEYNIYVLASQIKNYSKDKIITLDECLTIDLPTNVCSNIDMDAKIEENQITFYRHYDKNDSFSIDVSGAKYIILQSHYAFIKTSSKIITYNFYDKSKSDVLNTQKFIIINDNICYVSNNNDNVSVGSNIIPKPTDYTFQDIIRVNNNIVAVFSKDNICSFVITTPEFKHFFNYEINVDKTIKSINLYSSTHYSRLCCLINYSSSESITKQFKAYQKVDLFMKF